MTSSIINNIKKNESVYNKQLLILDSKVKQEGETSSNFTNKFKKTERVSKIEIIDSNISNNIYNIDNDNSVLNINNNKLQVSIDNSNNLIVNESSYQFGKNLNDFTFN